MPKTIPPEKNMPQLEGKDYNSTAIEKRVEKITEIQPNIPEAAAHAAVTAVKTSFNNDFLEAAAISIAAQSLSVDNDSLYAKGTAIYFGHDPFSEEGRRAGLKDSAIASARELLVSSGVRDPQQADLNKIVLKATELLTSGQLSR